MLTPSTFRDLVSGRRRGAAAAAMRLGLRLLETPYAAAIRWRNRRYDSGRASVSRVGVPVVSVGNLTLGGTGKTPMVQWLAQWFADRGVRVAVISRGYGAASGQPNDEALELAQKLPGVPHLQDPDRVAAARRAIAEHAAELLLLDDAFQHRRIARDLDLVMLDALEPLGFGHVFPRGTLREPPEGLRRADVVVLSRADILAPEERAALRRRVERYAPQAAWLEVAHAPQTLVASTGRQAPLESLRGQEIAAFCGIGNPAGFRHTLDVCGWRVSGLREFPDHHRYTPADVRSLSEWAEGLASAAVVCTHKDLVKLGVDRLGRLPLWALGIGLEFLAGREGLEAKLEALLHTERLPRYNEDAAERKAEP